MLLVINNVFLNIKQMCHKNTMLLLLAVIYYILPAKRNIEKMN